LYPQTRIAPHNNWCVKVIVLRDEPRWAVHMRRHITAVMDLLPSHHVFLLGTDHRTCACITLDIFDWLWLYILPYNGSSSQLFCWSRYVRMYTALTNSMRSLPYWHCKKLGGRPVCSALIQVDAVSFFNSLPQYYRTDELSIATECLMNLDSQLQIHMLLKTMKSLIARSKKRKELILQIQLLTGIVKRSRAIPHKFCWTSA
jgi:hypothetical protein